MLQGHVETTKDCSHKSACIRSEVLLLAECLFVPGVQPEWGVEPFKIWCCVKCKIKYNYVHFGSLDNIIDDKSGVHEKEATNLLSQYLSKLTFTDADGLRLPNETLPQGFLFNHQRCSRRTLYTPRLGFTMIVSREQSWSCDAREEDSRETVTNYFLSLIGKLNDIHVQKLNCNFLNPTSLFCI